VALANALEQYFPVDGSEAPILEEFSQPYDTERLTYSRREFEELADKVRAALSGFSWEGRSAVGKELYELLWRSGNRAAVPMMIRGSLYLLVWHALSVLGRISDEERAPATEVFRSGSLSCFDYMASQLETIVFDSLDTLDRDVEIE
jgi:hypothetical protein